ncbi:beta strand repeat-containing protein, partial [Flavihumibacter stibioxidans]|uniref:beta strand repeat-containing protein n=1 Tax=Flavihumibacter stibioxidans TaxID=1834163 RepID=UPI0031B56AB6
MTLNLERPISNRNVRSRKLNFPFLLLLFLQVFYASAFAFAGGGEVGFGNNKKPIVVGCPILGGTIGGNTATICAGEDPGQFNVNTPATESGIPLNTITYQWQSSPDGTSWTDITGAVSPDYDVPVLSSTTIYRRVATLVDGATTCSAFSNNVTIAVNPRPTAVLSVGDAVICAGQSTNINITFTGGSTFNFELDGSPRANISSPFSYPVFPTATQSYPVTSLTNNFGCSALTGDITGSSLVTVNPVPTVNDPADLAVCNGSSTATVSFTGAVTGTVYNWTNNTPGIGLAASGTGNIGSFTAVNTGTTPITATITVTPTANSCIGTPQTFTITVNPTATVTDPANQTVCNGSSTAAVSFTGAVTGTTYSWTNDNTAIGLGASGTGNIPAFTAVNTGSTPITATITVTPTANSCIGTPQTFTITVNPTATVTDPANQTVCNGSSTAAVSFTGAVTGTTYSWTNDNTAIGLGASGTGNIPAFTATNTGTTPITATITVTPTANSCIGTPQTFTITVNPTATVTDPANQTVCNGSSTAAVSFTGAVTGTTYSWTNDNTAIGLGASGIGNIPAFTAVNTGSTPITATITVTPTANSCIGTPQTFTITVNPTPTVVDPANQILCSAAATTAINFSGAVNGTTYNWTNNNTSIGLAANGTGDIPSFIASNTGVVPVTATITVTPTANSCAGPSQSFTISVTPIPTATINYPATAFCRTVNTAQPVFLTGTAAYTGGSYSSSPAGLALNPATGAITPSTSAAGTYTITYTIPASGGCPAIPVTTTVTITELPTAGITYLGGPFCENDNTARNVTLSGTSGGIFSVSPATGLAINSTTGSFVPNGSTPGVYTITYTIPASGGCAQVSTTTSVTITELPTAIISYAGTPFCTSVTSPQPVTLTGSGNYSGGTYSASSPGLTISSSTGSITPSTSAAGTYIVTYTKPGSGGCANLVSTTTVTITQAPSATISYAGGPFCPNTGNKPVTITGTTGGTFSSTPGLIINASNGNINTNATTPGTYTVTYQITAANGCASFSTTTTVVVNDAIAPVLIIPATANIQCGQSILPANTGQATATDNCSGSVTINYSDVTIAGNCAGRYTITRTWTAIDVNNNTSTGTQTINVDDIIPPTITCTNFSVNTPNDIPPPDNNTITVIDNCGGPVTIELISETYTGLQGKPGFCPSSVLRTWKATDACGNTSTCVQTITVNDVSNCTVCQSNVPFFPVNLEGNPDSLYISPQVIREGLCCGVTGPPPPRCISFNVFLDKDAVGIIFDIYSGAPPSGALFYQINCGPEIPVGEPICLAGNQFYTITFCKPGNNQNEYSIRSISGLTGQEGLTTRADAKCNGQLSFTGVDPNTVSWSVVSPNDQSLLSYLSCTDCLTPTFTPDANAPASIVYKVCGTLPSSLLCDGQPIVDCKEVTVQVLAPINVTVEVPPFVCPNNIPTLQAVTTPASSIFNYRWFNAYDGAGSLVSSGSANYKPTAAGQYSVVVTEIQSGILCNTDTANFDVVFDLTNPFVIPPSPLTIECNDPNAQAVIQAWLATATATDATDPGVQLTVTNNYQNFSQSCNLVRTITFSATDVCGNIGTATADIIVIDQTPPNISCPPALNVSCPSDVPAPAVNYAQFIAAGGTASDLCDAQPVITWIEDIISNQDPNCVNSYTITRRYRASDACGNSITCDQTITVNNTAPPQVPANAGSTVQCPADAVQPTPAFTVYDACGTPITPTVISSEDPECEGTKTYTFTYTDCAGLFSNWVYTYIIDRITPPVVPANAGSIVSCPDATDIAPVLPVVTDVCGNVLTPSAPEVSVKPGCEGTRTYRYTFTDCSGLSSVWIYTYTVERLPFADPVDAGSTVTCPDATDIAPVLPTVTDNCGNVLTPSAPVISAKPTCEGTRRYTYTYTDCEGNTQNWVYTYTVEFEPFADPVDAGSTVACPDATDIAPVLPTVTDNCGRVLTPSAPVISAKPTCEGTRRYTYTYTDCEGNTQDWVYTYTVEFEPFADPVDAGSTVACPDATDIAPVLPRVTDNCGNVLTPSAPVISAKPTCEGTRTYTYTYTDCEGNTQDWVYTYTVEFEPFVDPVDAGSTVACPDATDIAPVLPTVTDNCGNVLTPSAPVISAKPACEGTRTYTYTYTDCEGNTQDWVYTYTLSSPVFTLPANGGSVVACVAEAVVPTAPAVTDNCGRIIDPTVSEGVDPECIGTKVYTFTYEDCSGGSQIWTYTYTISAPVFTLPANGASIVACIADAVVPVPPVVTDNCGRTLVPSAPVVSADPSCGGTKTYEFTYTDCSGASQTWVYTYTFPVPEFTLPANGSSVVSCLSDAVVPTAPTVVDACGAAVSPVMTESSDPACVGTKVYTFTYSNCAG